MKKFSPNLTDQELYDLFKQAAENYQPRYGQDEKQEQWDKIKLELLEEKIPERGRKSGSYRWRRITFILLLGALLFGAGEVFIGSMMKENEMMNLKKEPVKSKTHQYKQSIHREDTSILNVISGTEPSETIGKIKNNVVVPPHSLDRNLETTFRDVHVQINHTTATTLQHHGVNKLITGLTKHDTNGIMATPNTQNDAKPDRVVKKRTLPRWSVGVAVGTDWSGVKTKINGRTALDVGITIQRRFSRRWLVESGLLLTSKLYSAGPADYTSTVSYPALFRVDAECRIFDLPINVRYDAIQRNDHMAFISAGISSIWMQKENYLLRSKVNGMVQTAEYNYYNDNKHLLSIVNLSAGYEHSWNRFGLQVAPYLKLPLKGIGAGEVKLASAGVLISAKYSFK